MATYLVTGATGFLGSELTKRLLRRDRAEIHVQTVQARQAALIRGKRIRG